MSQSASGKGAAAFTLVEMLVAVTILIVILGLLFSVLQQTAALWKGSTGKMEGFRDARTVFEAVTRTIGQATLNNYYDYQYGANGQPIAYFSGSDLQFICGKNLLANVQTIPNPVGQSVFFQAPLGYSGTSSFTGRNGLLNACGFYVQYGADTTSPSFLSSIIPPRYRYRLMEFTQPSQNLSIYDPVASGTTNNWFLVPLGQNPAPVSQLAENVVTLVLLPQLSAVSGSSSSSLAPAYEYNSRDSTSSGTYNELPPIVEVTMVVMDDASAVKLRNSPSPPNLAAGAPFTAASQLSNDLSTLEANLSGIHGNQAANSIPLRFQVFQLSVPILDAKWNSSN